MSKFAYLDNGGILKIGSSDEAREKFKAEGRKMIDVTIDSMYGYPVVDGKEIAIYGIGLAYFGKPRVANEVKLKNYPELLDLYILYRNLM